jgi:hypothetical protein
MKEKCSFSKDGQWDIKKWDMEKRCWEGYEPTPGKKAYSEDSCKPIKKDEVAPKNSRNKKTYEEAFCKSEDAIADNEVEIVEWDNGELDVLAGNSVPDKYLDFIAKSICEKAEYTETNKSENFQLKSEHKSDKGGLTEAGRKAYNKATGGNLKAPQPGGGPRKRSFCARNKGQIDMHNIDCKKDPDKRACKARRRWKC